MAELRFEGVVTDLWPTMIGDRDVYAEVEDKWPFRDGHGKAAVHTLKVMLGVEPPKSGILLAAAAGHLYQSPGFHGTEVTPPELPEIFIGNFELLKKLNELDGRTVLLIIEDA